MIESIATSTLLEGAASATVLIALVGALVWWIKGLAERGRVKNEGAIIQARIEAEARALQGKIEETFRGEAATRFKEFREEVHGLRNDVARLESSLLISTAQSVRRGDKLNMILFILSLVMEELAARDPTNKILAQARSLLARVEIEPHEKGNSTALNQAEDTVEAAQATVREVKAEEAKR